MSLVRPLTARERAATRGKKTRTVCIAQFSQMPIDRLVAQAKGTAYEDSIYGRIDAYLLTLPWWYGHLDDTKHRQAQARYRRDRLAAEQRDILAKETVRRYETGYQARKAKRDRRAVLDTLAAEGMVLASRGKAESAYPRSSPRGDVAVSGLSECRRPR